MRSAIARAIYIKNIVAFSVISCAGFIALLAIGNELFASVRSGEEILIPGIAILILAVLLVLLFGVTRVIKYIKLCGRG